MSSRDQRLVERHPRDELAPVVVDRLGPGRPDPSDRLHREGGHSYDPVIVPEARLQSTDTGLVPAREWTSYREGWLSG